MEVKEQVLVIAEEAAKAIVDSAYDKVMDLCFEELKKVIPSTIDDAVIDMLKPILEPKLKDLLLAEIAKISPQA